MNDAIEFRSIALNLSAIEPDTKIQYLEVGSLDLNENIYQDRHPSDTILWVVYARIFYGDILVARALADSTTEEGANELKTLLEKVINCFSGPTPQII